MSAKNLQEEPSSYPRSVASEVAAQMGRAGRISALELAAAAGVSYAKLTRSLRVERPFDVEMLEKIAHVLNCEVRDFMPPADGTTYRGTTRDWAVDREPLICAFPTSMQEIAA